MPHEIPAELTQREFEVFVTRVADDLSYGEDVSSFLGSGIDYAQSRPYVPGDSVRDIDWRGSARPARLFIKEYEALKRVPFLLVVDTSGSMVASSTAVSKFDLACVVAGAVGLAALRRQSPVGLLGAGERPLRHRTLSRHGHRRRLRSERRNLPRRRVLVF